MGTITPSKAPKTRKRQSGKITCRTKLPDGSTVGDNVRKTAAALSAANNVGGQGSGLGGFISAVNTGGPIDFKNNFKGQAPATFLAAAGNFAYGALSNQHFGSNGVARQMMFAGASLYAALHGKDNFIPNGTIFRTDASAAAFAGPGFDAGCRQ